MMSVKLRIAELRRHKGIGQQELADVLGISFQSVSKWETGITMPDITLLPSIAEYFTNKAKFNNNTEYDVKFIVSDIYSFETDKKYDMAICQAGLRHMNNPKEVLKKMTDSVKNGGLVVCIDVNREFENDGLYIDDISYDYLCTAFDFHKAWKKELECEGRDYAIGMRLPFYMQQLGLKDIDIRMNDKVMFVNPDMQDYEEKVQDFIEINGLDESFSISSKEKEIELFMSRGIDRVEAEAHVKKQFKIAEYFRNTERKKSFLKVQGLLITYGRK